MSDPLGSNFLNNSIANFAMEEHVLLEHVVEADDDDYDYDEESSSNDSSSDDDEMDQDEESSSYDGSSYDDEMDQDEFCGSYGSSSSLGKSPLPSMSPPPRNMQEIDRQRKFEEFENQQMLFVNNSENGEDSDKGQEDDAMFSATDRAVPTSALIPIVNPNNNNGPS